MTEQARYSAEDIHRMRRAALMLATPMGVSFKSDEVARTAEAMLVTYMANGTTPDELVEHAHGVSEERFAAEQRAWERQDAARTMRLEHDGVDLNQSITVTHVDGIPGGDSRNLRDAESAVYPPRTRIARFLSRLRGQK